MKKAGTGLLAGLIMLLVSFGVAAVLPYLSPTVQSEYDNQCLFRPWTDPLMLLMFLQPVLIGLLLTWVWGMVKEHVRGNTPLAKGFNYALGYWLTTVPGMLITYSTFPVSIAMIAGWSGSSLVQALFGCIVISKLLN